MARDIKTISNGMKVEFVRNETLRTSFGIDADISNMDEQALVACYDSHLSSANVVSVLLYVVACCAALIEHTMDWFVEDVDRAIASERYGHEQWYVNVAKNFQYDGTTDYGLDEQTGQYATEDEEHKIVSYVSCEDNGFGVKIKVAKGEIGNLQPLTSDEIEAFSYYMGRLKPAGMPISVISEAADRLRLKMTVYYNPSVFSRALILNAVKERITQYLQSIDFNGQFVTMKMVDSLQTMAGVEVVEVAEVYAQYAGYDYRRIENDALYIPYSGYMRLAEDIDLEITTLAYV